MKTGTYGQSTKSITPESAVIFEVHRRQSQCSMERHSISSAWTIACRMLAIFTLIALCLSRPAAAATLVYEGFDIPTGDLNGNGGTSSIGWLSTWDSGIFASPKVESGSLSPPASTSSFYTAPTIGNHVDTFGNLAAPFGAGGLADRRFMSLDGNSSLYWTLLAQPDLISGQMRLTFDIPGQFNLYAAPSGLDPFVPTTWQLFLPGTIIDTGVDANQLSLLAFQLNYNGAASLVADEFSFWVNLNPLTDVPTYQGMHDFGSTVWGIGAEGRFGFASDPLTNKALVDEFRIGTDWASVGIVAIPEPSSFALIGSMILGWTFRRRNRDSQPVIS